MRRLIVQPPARSDERAILTVSFRNFGLAARNRYRALLQQAYANLQNNPLRAGSVERSDLPGRVRVYHLRHARSRLAKEKRTARPRHFIVFTFDEDAVRIVRVLHDAMDLAGHLAPLEESAEEQA
ncbi:MAG: type II toxin-antitoxin system RelE/ParE family toxin [Hyphomonadaceae bacterium]|nr:type II toxin-antitoxin system RelE/ParE family toxin [Hyphomonadaceae bacterium]